MVCRLYPVGRIVDTDASPYFFLTEVAEYCRLGSGREYTIEEWLEEAQVEPFFEWNDGFDFLYTGRDHEKYKALELPYKAALGGMLYHPDILAAELPEEVKREVSRSDDVRLEIGYRMAKTFVEKLQRTPLTGIVSHCLLELRQPELDFADPAV